MKVRLSLVMLFILGLAAGWPADAAQAGPVVRQFGGYEITMTPSGPQPGQTEVVVKNQQTGRVVFSLTVPDVYTGHYHNSEYQAGSLYVIRRVGSGSDWLDELWRYDAAGQEQKLYAARGLDFRTAPGGQLVAASSGASLSFVDAGGRLVREFPLEQLSSNPRPEVEEIDVHLWSADGAAFWGRVKIIGRPQTLFRVEPATWQVSRADVSGLPMFWDEALNPNTGQLAYSDHPALISEESAEQFKQSNQPVTLFLYDFYRQSQAAIATAAATAFRPEWLDDDTLAYDDPAGGGRVIQRLAPPLPGSASSRAELEAELLVQGYITETQAIDWAGAGYEAVIYRPADFLASTHLPNHLVIYKSQAEETVILGLLEEPQRFEFAPLANQETPAGWLDINGDGRLELPYLVENGGNCYICAQIRVLQLRPDDSVVDLTRAVPPEDTLGAGHYGFGVRSLVDVNGDGLWEWVVLDARWEFRFDLPHVASPGSLRVYTWDGQVYRNASAQFPEYYRRRLEEGTADIRAMAESDEPVSEYLASSLISLLLDYENAGRGQEGWAIFKQYADPALYAGRVEGDGRLYSLLEARELFRTWYEPGSAPAPVNVTISTQPPSRDEGGRLHALGEVTNHSTGPLEVGPVVAGLYAADGSLVDVGVGWLPLTFLNPGQSVPYDLSWFSMVENIAAQAAQVTEARVRVAWTLPSPFQGIPLTTRNETWERSDEYWYIQGEVVNTSGRPLVEYTDVVVALYDEQGRLVAAGADVTKLLAPAEVEPYHVLVRLPPDVEPAMLTIKSYGQGYVRQ